MDGKLTEMCPSHQDASLFLFAKWNYIRKQSVDTNRVLTPLIMAADNTLQLHLHHRIQCDQREGATCHYSIYLIYMLLYVKIKVLFCSFSVHSSDPCICVASC